MGRFASASRHAPDGHGARAVSRLQASVYLVGGVYNFCTVHATLGQTPALATAITDHVWGMPDLLTYRIPPVYQPVTRRGRRRRNRPCANAGDVNHHCWYTYPEKEVRTYI